MRNFKETLRGLERLAQDMNLEELTEVTNVFLERVIWFQQQQAKADGVVGKGWAPWLTPEQAARTVHFGDFPVTLPQSDFQAVNRLTKPKQDLVGPEIRKLFPEGADFLQAHAELLAGIYEATKPQQEDLSGVKRDLSLGREPKLKYWVDPKNVEELQERFNQLMWETPPVLFTLGLQPSQRAWYEMYYRRSWRFMTAKLTIDTDRVEFLWGQFWSQLQGWHGVEIKGDTILNIAQLKNVVLGESQDTLAEYIRIVEETQMPGGATLTGCAVSEFESIWKEHFTEPPVLAPKPQPEVFHVRV